MARSELFAFTPARLLNGLVVLTSVLMLLYLGFALAMGYSDSLLWGLAAIMSAAALVRIRFPTLDTAATTVFVLSTTVAALIRPTGGMSIALVFITQIIVSAALWRVAAWVYLVVVAVVVAIVDQQDPVSLSRGVLEAIVTGTMLAVALVTGVLIRNLRASLETTAQLFAERAAAHAELESMHRRLHESVEREKDLVLAEERARAARDLHDGLGQRLTTLRMSLDYALRVRADHPDKAWAEIASARDTARSALAEMRRWVRALHPVTVAGLPPNEALEAIAESFRGTGFEVAVRLGRQDRMLTEDEALYLYRLVQEGLTNSLRHGRATRAELFVDLGPACHIELSDNGLVNAVNNSSEPMEGFGLRSLRERAEALGGKFSATPGDNGFLLRAELPAAELEAGSDASQRRAA